MPKRVLAILNRPSMDAPAHDPDAMPLHFADVAQPHLSVLDLAATRGDGIFETLSVCGGVPQALEHHLARFARSAAMLDLPAPDLNAWREVILATVAKLEPAAEAFVKIVLTRGVEGMSVPTGWAYAEHSPDFTDARTRGIRVALLDRGYRHDVAHTSPWLLAGAKTLSYAVNKAVLREAARRGADDVVFVSSDGILLEGPTSTLVYRRANTLVTPAPDLGILDGTTQANIFKFAAARGMQTVVEAAGPDALREADAAWLLSSVRLVAPIRLIDDVSFPIDVDLSAAMNEYLLGLRE